VTPIVRAIRYTGFAVSVLAGASSCADAPTPPLPSASAAVLVGAGDIARCPPTGAAITASLLDRIPGTVFTVGDNAYDDGSTADFAECYEPTWGRHKARTRPAPGNHEYHSPGAAPYYAYFGAAAGPPGRGYYSYDIAGWHVLSLNSNVDAGAGSAQVAWLRADLAAHRTRCAVAYWHHPVFSSGEHGNDRKMAEVWRVLDSAGVDLVLVGHDHNYERFAPQDYQGRADPGGIRQIVVGTGGGSLRAFGTIRANSEVRNSRTLGVIKVTLHPDSYEWQFVAQAGATFSDAGTAACAD
jgi:acid phosphatase type 7